MGDVPASSNSTKENQGRETFGSGLHGTTSSADHEQRQGPEYSGTTAYHPQFHHNFYQSQNIYPAPFETVQYLADGRPGRDNMSQIATVLPPGYRSGINHSNQQRYSSGPPHSRSQQIPHIPPYGGQNIMSPGVSQQYYMPQPHQIPNASMANPFYTSQVFQYHQQRSNIASRIPVGYYSNHPGMSQSHHSLPSGYYYSMPDNFQIQPQILGNQTLLSQHLPSNGRGKSQTTVSEQAVPSHRDDQATVDDRSNLVRGPPRKPRQNGHAIWIGNLPPQTDLMTLVHHVSGKTRGLESLFLISKSNCAFANFKDEMSCVTAQQQLHDSTFQSVRLVSRLRKNTVAGGSGQTAPTGPTATASRGQEVHPGRLDSQPASVQVAPEADPPSSKNPDDLNKTSDISIGAVKDKFFILKSLTTKDLELSVRNGIWATQSHNEVVLNDAFQKADNVYLVFSANKSGEYFGFARMTSQINDDPAAAIEFSPRAQRSTEEDLPKAILTEATANCPKGKIIDDSARGTIFWELEREEAGMIEGEDWDDSASQNDAQEGESERKVWGKPFTLEWLSTSRLPFYRTRGLRNPWNSNREVKIARDGTELEPEVGKRLIGLFNRTQISAPSTSAMTRLGQ